jgi:hypothetical protein
MRWYEFMLENATAGATSAGCIASVAMPLWNGPVKGRYPYVVPDYEAAGVKQKDMVPRAEPGKPNPFAGGKVIKRMAENKKKRRKKKKK